jgi:WhiB family transcriptional regulator, redox-sensing transcriptional regulator
VDPVRLAPDVSPDGSLELDVPRWYRDARCADADPEAFFPPKGGTGAEALAICGTCPVVELCLAYALELEGDSHDRTRAGVWGGTTPRQRAALARQSAAA